MKKILFCGFGKLGKYCALELERLGYEIVYIFTHKENDIESVDTFAIDNDIDYTYLDARKDLTNIKNNISNHKASYLISVNYRYIIPKEIFSLFEHAINIHGSLLPKYRGRTPHVWSIINGEEYGGVSVHLIEKTVDTGDIIVQEPIKISEEDTGFTLLEKYQSLYPQILGKALLKINNGDKLITQNEANASYFGKRTPQMGYIDFYKSSNEVINFVRAQAYPYPGAYYYLNNGKKIIINKIVVNDTRFNIPIGIIAKRNTHYYVNCKDKTLRLDAFEIR